MTITVRAKFVNGQLTPLEPLELEEGREVVIRIEDGPGVNSAAGSVLDIFGRMHQSAPPGTWDDLPGDGSKNVDHYLYGWPKAEG